MAHIAQVHYHQNERRLEVVVPRGTLPNATGRLNETLTKDLIPRLTGHPGCFSGLDFVIREELADIVQIDLETGKIGPGISGAKIDPSIGGGRIGG